MNNLYWSTKRIGTELPERFCDVFRVLGFYNHEDAVSCRNIKDIEEDMLMAIRISRIFEVKNQQVCRIVRAS